MNKLLPSLTLLAIFCSPFSTASNLNEHDSAYLIAGAGFTSENTGFNLTGGVQMTENVHMEVSMHVNMDEYDDELFKASSDVSIFSFTPAYFHEVDENIKLYGKAGLFFVNGELTVTKKHHDNRFNNPSSMSYSETAHGFTYGAGIQYMSSKPVMGAAKFTARLGVDWYNLNNVKSLDLGTESIVGVQIGIGI